MSGGLIALLDFDPFIYADYRIKKDSANIIRTYWKYYLLRKRAKQQLNRLKICREIELIPGFGVKYYLAMNSFYSLTTDS